MTTKVIIKNDDGSINEIKVHQLNTQVDVLNGLVNGFNEVILEPGDKMECYVYDTQSLFISEIPD